MLYSTRYTILFCGLDFLSFISENWNSHLSWNKYLSLYFSQIVTAYVSATTSALVTALGLKSLLANVSILSLFILWCIYICRNIFLWWCICFRLTVLYAIWELRNWKIFQYFYKDKCLYIYDKNCGLLSSVESYQPLSL